MAKLPNGGMRYRWLVAQMKAEQAAKDGNDSNAAQTDGETDRK